MKQKETRFSLQHHKFYLNDMSPFVSHRSQSHCMCVSIEFPTLKKKYATNRCITWKWNRLADEKRNTITIANEINNEYETNSITHMKILFFDSFALFSMERHNNIL